MDEKYWLLAGVVVLALIFIKKIWHTLLILALGAVAYWYFFIR